MKQITKSEEIINFEKAAKLRVHSNFEQIHNFRPEEERSVILECENNSFMSTFDELYEIGNGYYLTIYNNRRVDGTNLNQFSIWRIVKKFNSIKEIKELINSFDCLRVRNLKLYYENLNDKSFYINDTEVILPISENELSKIFVNLVKYN